MLDYGFFSDCFRPSLKVSSQYPCRFECIEVSEILFNYSLPHFKILVLWSQLGITFEEETGKSFNL